MAAAPSAPLHVKGPPEAAAPTLSNRIPGARTALHQVLEDQQQRSQRRIFHFSFVKNPFLPKICTSKFTQLIALWYRYWFASFEFKLLQL